ncbi:hypothetical protein AS156_06130 [Bradyrhizobium macuxiense]|uniref:Uncharacterized protein n=1 Tax=Bradyrhizobium macuxiense TaxID=1755647 RepID=A0A109JUA5_9BRAD|nr:hypothetical protein AS156_06130 [Bradyrhizobium macuxiense]
MFLVLALNGSGANRGDVYNPFSSSGAPVGPLDKLKLARDPGNDRQYICEKPQTDVFIARDHFKEDITSTARIKMAWLGATFVRKFAAKVEGADATPLQTYMLQSSANNDEFVRELSARDEAKLVDIWCLLRLQANGESGALQTTSLPNTFFVRDGTGALAVIDVVWGGAGWEIGASPIESRRTWPRGTRVFSR